MPFRRRSARSPFRAFSCASFLFLSLLSSVWLAPTLAAQQSADEQYRFLAGLIEKGLYEMAAQEAQGFLQAYPQHEKAPLARYRLATALWELERRDEATREYELLARAAGFEYQAECLFRCGEAALARGDETRATSAFEAVLRAKQDYLIAPALFSLGEAALHAKRYDQAEKRYAELLRTRPDAQEAPLARRALVWCSWERGDARQTIERARAFLEHEPDPGRSDEVRLVLGEALLSTNDAASALETYRSVQTREEADARARGIAFAQAALGDHAAAARSFEALLASAPEGRFAREAALQAGIEHLRANDARGAVERLAPAAKSGDPETLYWLAQAQKSAGDTRSALASLDQALRARPAPELEERIHVLRGDCLGAEGRGAEALAAYEKSGSEQALYAGAVAALNQGDPAGATRLAERVLAGHPDEERAQGARLVLAEALFARADYAAAERAFAALLPRPAREGSEKSAGPSLPARCRSRLAWCRYLAGDLATARQRFSELLERHASSAEAEEALAMLVRLALEQKDPAAARAPAERYLERYPEGRFLDQVLLARARTAQGENARPRYEEFLERCPKSPLCTSALLELGELESAAGRHEQAARRYTEALARAPAGPERARASYGLAWCAWSQGDLAACEQAAQELAGAKDIDAALRGSALDLLISAQVRRQQLDAAMESWRRLARLGGDEKRCFEAARRLVAALRAAGKTGPAQALLAECTRALRDPALVAAGWIEAAYLALDSQDFSGAASALKAAEKSGATPASVAEASFHLGDAELEAGETDQALVCFATASASDHPRAPDALYKLGFVELQRGRLEEARRPLATLLERHPESELAREARFLLGEIAYRSGRLEEAAGLLAEVQKDATGELRAKVLFRSGLAAGKLARWAECEGALNELASSFPEFSNLAEAELWRGRALLAQKKTRAARAAFERTLALDQGELAAGARLGLGLLLEGEGRVEDALSEYLKVALLYAHEESVAEALYRAGRALEALGDPKKAAERYRELREQHAHSPFVPPAEERLRALENRS